MQKPESRKLSRKELLKRAAMVAPVPILMTAGTTAAMAVERPEALPRDMEPTPFCDDGDDPTPRQTEGPYFKPNSPERSNLVEAGMPGTRLTVSGYVFSRDCRPVARALLDFWQADSNGAYDNSGYRLRGHQYTDDAGRFSLSTVVPGLYPGRTRHIHVKVQAPNQPILTTQLYFPNEPRNSTDSLFDPRLLMTVRDVTGGREGTFDFVLDYTQGPGPSPTGSPAPGTYSGSLAAGASQYQPNGSYYESAASGTHTAYLDGPAGADFDLYLQKWNGWSWSTVARAETSSDDERINYSGTAGRYRYRVYAYSGSGRYTLTITKP